MHEPSLKNLSPEQFERLHALVSELMATADEISLVLNYVPELFAKDPMVAQMMRLITMEHLKAQHDAKIGASRVLSAKVVKNPVTPPAVPHKPEFRIKIRRSDESEESQSYDLPLR